MKRTLLGLVMLSGLALMAAPKANAAALGECGKSYAMEMHGTQPSSTNDAALRYIVGIGQITFAAAGTNGPTGCTVSHLEVIYNDNDFGTFYAGPASCYFAQSLLGGGLPCFDGASHQSTTGTLAPSVFGGGAQTLNINPSFAWTNGGPAASNLPLSFTLMTNTGSSIAQGNSVPDAGPTASAPVPQKPVLVITLQKQSTTVTLPKTGPAGCGALGCTGGGNNGYGVAPYLGLSNSLFQGYGAPSADPFAQPIDGSFGSTISSLQIFANGLAGGVASFSSNDNIGNTTGADNVSCDTTVAQTGNFASGSSNQVASIVHPVSANCADAFAAGQFTLATVVFGTTDTSTYSIVTGLAAATLTGGLFVPPGLMSDALGLASAPPGFLHTTATVNAVINTETGALVQKVYSATNTSPAGCDVAFNMATVGPSGPGGCKVQLAGGNPTNVLVEGGTVNPAAATVQCTCSATPEDDTGVTSTLTVTSSDCQVSVGAGPITVQCHN
jgi:hypothetical protein